VKAILADSSALVKRYVVERGSGWMAALLDPGSGVAIYAAAVTEVEVVAALARRIRGGSLAAADGALAIGAVRRDLAGRVRRLALSAGVLARATDLAERHALRGYDAIQLAAALEANAMRSGEGAGTLTLVSADVELNAAAAAEGLAVDDPNAHP
jgi:uncharacterized protein